MRVGDVLVGGANPIVIQSMTVSDTNDIAASTDEVIRLSEAGAAIVRLTVPSKKAAESMGEIHRMVRARGVSVPLVADIHYTPSAASLVAEIVEKVRINPGNLYDRPGRSSSGGSFEAGAARVAEQFAPFVRKLAEHGTALRIGVNHGSLSERMTSQYGDTPLGMVESAIEYLAVCERLGFHDVIVSLKSSIPAVTVAANRLFAKKVDRAGWRTPLHVGVTEAGMGEEGRIRSASGIGTLLLDGIGDTIRVSLTEDPVKEIPAAREILACAGRLQEARSTAGELPLAPPRIVSPVPIGPVRVGGLEPVAVIGPAIPMSGNLTEPPDLVLLKPGEARPSWIEENQGVIALAGDIAQMEAALECKPDGIFIPFPRGRSESESDSSQANDLIRRLARSDVTPLVHLDVDRNEDTGQLIDSLRDQMGEGSGQGVVICVTGRSTAEVVPAAEAALAERDLTWPLIIVAPFEGSLLEATIDVSGPLLGGIGSAILVGTVERSEGVARLTQQDETALSRAWDLLQATRRRVTRVEYISCPSCGRTLFDLEKVTLKISERTSHLKGVKIAIMGCIVNGPGEMADADFGYVGSGPEKIDLYVGAEKVVKNIPEEEAVDRLIKLIADHGRWAEPE